MKTLEYRENTYFNDVDVFLFETHGKQFKSKCHFEKGFWWTNEPLNYKCTSVKSLKLENENT